MNVASSTEAATEPRSRRGVASLVLGVVGIGFALSSVCTCGFSAWPGLVCGIAGVICRRRAVLPWVAVFLCLVGVCFSLLWTPLADHCPLNRVRFALMMGPCRFWADYNKGTVKAVRNRELLFSSTALLVYESREPGTFKLGEVVLFAAEHGCEFDSKRQLPGEILGRLAAAEETCPPGEDRETWRLVQHMARRFTLPFYEDSTLVVFHGPEVSSALVLVAEDGRQMAVYCGHGCRD